MNTWTPLWSPIVDSSLWEEDGDVVKVFMTILATKNSDHVCELDAYKMANRCNFRLPDGSVDELKVVGILKILASPDTRRKVKQDYEGRRIQAVKGGWFVLNGEKYREMVSIEMTKAKNRRGQAAWRERKALKEKANGHTKIAGSMDKRGMNEANWRDEEAMSNNESNKEEQDNLA